MGFIHRVDDGGDIKGTNSAEVDHLQEKKERNKEKKYECQNNSLDCE